MTADARLTSSSGAYSLRNGTVVAASGSAFFSTVHDAAIDVDEQGNTVSGSEVWTGADGTGGCNDWTSAANSAPYATIGLTSGSVYTWEDAYLQFCDRANVRLYCVEQ